MNVRKISVLSGLSVIFLAVMACTINIGGPAYPNQHIPVSTEAVGELQFAMQTAVAAGADSGQITLLITEPQLTSYLATQLQTQAQPLFTDPQVYLRDGQIQIYGTVTQGYLQVTIEIVVTAGVDQQGQLKIELTTADFGPLPVPTGLKDTVTAAIQEAYTGSIGPAAIGFRLESITVADGTMTIIGRTK
jgi:uncharacterized protein YpmS